MSRRTTHAEISNVCNSILWSMIKNIIKWINSVNLKEDYQSGEVAATELQITLLNNKKNTSLGHLQQQQDQQLVSHVYIRGHDDIINC